MSESHDHKDAHAGHAGHGHGDIDRHVRAAYYVFGSLLVYIFMREPQRTSRI